MSHKTTPAQPRDPYRPQYHFSAPTGWINDPNGLIHWRGDYHLFYQYHPHSPYWGPMHWGHAISKDLLHWQHLPLALAPEPSASADDRSGIFSGSAVDDDGTLTLMYTDHTDVKCHPGIPVERQAIATSRDGVHFAKYAGNPVIPSAPEGASAGFRDPKVWREADGLWSVVLGSGHDGRGRVHLYRSPDLRQWTYHGVLFEGDGTTGKMWECPDLFPLGDKHVLIVSVSEPAIQPTLQAVFYFLGDYRNDRFTAEKCGKVDGGLDFYAPQTFPDAQGRRIMIAWMDRWSGAMPTQTLSNWAGAMALPRELFLRPDGDLGTRPVAELRSLRHAAPRFEQIEACVLTPAAANPLADVTGETLEILVAAQFNASPPAQLNLKLRQTPDDSAYLLVSYDVATATLTLDRNRAGIGDGGGFTVALPLLAENLLRLQIFVDRSSVEIFANDGAAAISARYYPASPDCRGLSLTAQGGKLTLNTLAVWEL